jgi:hypothetical protein
VTMLGSHDIDFTVMGPAILQYEVLWWSVWESSYFSSLVVRKSLAVHCCVFRWWR